MKIDYCHMCGKILTKDKMYNIVGYNINAKKQKVIFSTCATCGKKIMNMQFPMVKLTPTGRKKPDWTSITIKKITGKQKLVYDVLPHQLEIIKNLEIDIDKLKLRYEDGTRIYTETQVKTWMQSSTENLVEAMMMVYKHQTDDEKKTRETKYANSVGFNKPDASFMTGMCRIYECRGIDYTPAQLARMEKTMDKYSRQVTLYVNADSKILSGV